MITIIANFKVKSDKTEEFENLANDVARGSKKERGNVGYTIYKNRKASNEYTFVEEWLNDTIISNHNESKHFKAFISSIENILESDPEITQYEKINQVFC